MTLDIKESYLEQFTSFLKSLPKDAVKVSPSLDDEIMKRVSAYKSGEMKTSPFGEGLDEIRSKIASKL